MEDYSRMRGAMIVNARRRDPTGTGLVRRAYEKAILRRLRKLIADIQTSIVDRDCFGLASRPAFTINEPAGFQQFAFTTDARKHDAFMDWLRQQIDREVLEVVDRNGNPVEATYQDAYVRQAYEAGASQAAASVTRATGAQAVSGSFFF